MDPGRRTTTPRPVRQPTARPPRHDRSPTRRPRWPHHQRKGKHFRHPDGERRWRDCRPRTTDPLLARRHQHRVIFPQRLSARPLAERHLQLRNLLADRIGDINGSHKPSAPSNTGPPRWPGPPLRTPDAHDGGQPARPQRWRLLLIAAGTLASRFTAATASSSTASSTSSDGRPPAMPVMTTPRLRSFEFRASSYREAESEGATPPRRTNPQLAVQGHAGSATLVQQ